MSDETQAQVPPNLSREERLEQVLAEYLRQVEQGAPVDQQALLAAHPDLADDLREFFGNQMRIQRLMGAGSPPHGRNGTPTKLRYFGDYEILEVIAQGGMGVVYKARQTTLNRVVAVKMILAGQLANESDVKRFQAEAEAAANLHHPGVVAIYEVGINAGQPYYSMEYVEGRNLSAAIRENPVGIVQAAEYLRELAEIVEFAHSQGVLHRDLKPSNVLIDAADRLRVTDFGLAKRVQGESDLTMTGQVLGTPSYMAPEQAAAQHALVGPGSDVYSLGTMLYELLTGRPPFRSDNFAETLRQVQQEEPVRPRLLNPKLPRDLETICLKCLEKEPRRRYLSAQQMADELERFLRNEPILARSIGPVSRSWRWCRRKPAIASLAAMLASSLIVISTMTSLAYWRAATYAREIEGQNEKLSQAVVEQQKSAAIAKVRLYRSLVAQARGIRMSKRIGQRYESLKVLAEASRMAREMALSEADIVELRSEVIACLTLADVRTAKKWEGWPTGSLKVDFDGSLERYARMDRAGNVSVRQLTKDGRDLELAGVAGLGPGEAWPIISQDGQFLAVWGNRFKLWSLVDPKPTLLFEGAGRVVFSPDNKRMATLVSQGHIEVLELPSGKKLRELNITSPHTAAFHPQLPRLAISSATGVQVLDFDTGIEVVHLPLQGASDLEWHPDGNSIAVVGGDSNIYCWDVATGKLSTELKGHSAGTTLAFSSKGDILASAGWGQPLRLWNTQTAELLFQTPMQMNELLRFGRNDKRLAVDVAGDSQLRLLELAMPRDCYRTLVREPNLGVGIYCSSAMSPDGRILAAAMADGISLWDFASGKSIAFLPTEGSISMVRFEPCGALLASGQIGLVRWTVEVSDSGTIQIGTRQQLQPGGYNSQMGMSKDAQVIAQSTGWGGLLWNRDSADPPIKLEHDDGRFIDVSSNGHWVATGSHVHTKVKIWNAKTGVKAHELPVEGRSEVFFSSDSHRLVTSYDGNRIWSVDTGKELRYIGGEHAVAFSPDDKILAVEVGDGVIRLLDPETGLDYARLEDPNQDRARRASFSADGSQLTVVAHEAHRIHVWDLRAIRAKLAEMQLDWKLLPYPPVSAQASVKGNQLRVEIAK